MYNDVKNRNFNNNVYIIKLEDLYDINNLPKICSEIETHLNDKKINYNSLLHSFTIYLKFNFHRTNLKNVYTYTSLFKDEHYEKINLLYPHDLLKVLNY